MTRLRGKHTENETVRMLRCGPLTEWEDIFLTSLMRQSIWSEKQLLHYEKIKSKYLKTTPGEAPVTSAETLKDLF